MLKKWIAIFIACMATQPFGTCQVSEDKLSAEKAAVEEKLAEPPNQIVLAVNGLRCANCAIGIGKKVRRLDFVDIDALPQWSKNRSQKFTTDGGS